MGLVSWVRAKLSFGRSVTETSADAPLFDRKIRDLATWDSSAAEPLLRGGDVPADALSDIAATTNAALSVYRASDDIPVQMAIGMELARVRGNANKHAQVRTVFFLRFPAKLVEGLATPNLKISGKTGYRTADDLHCDLEGFTGKGLLRFAERLLRKTGAQSVQITEILDGLEAATNTGSYDAKKLPPGVAQQLKEHIEAKRNTGAD